MKIRQGFISNSSTTSFCIYGVCLHGNARDKSIAKPLEKIPGNPNYYNSEYFVGIPWCNIEDDETGAQFKARVKKLLLESGISEEPSTYKEAWYDG